MRESIQACASGDLVPVEDGYERTFTFGESFVGFQGHFPGRPILPAVVQLLAAQIAVESRVGKKLVLRRTKRAKFLRTIGPGDLVVMRWSEETRDGEIVCKAQLSVEGEKAAAFSLVLA